MCTSRCMPVCMAGCISVSRCLYCYQELWVCVHLDVCLSVWLGVCLSVWLGVCLSVGVCTVVKSCGVTDKTCAFTADGLIQTN